MSKSNKILISAIGVVILLIAILSFVLSNGPVFAAGSMGDKVEDAVKDGLINPCTGYATVKGLEAGLPIQISYMGLYYAYPWTPNIPMVDMELPCPTYCQDGCWPMLGIRNCTNSCWDISGSFDRYGGERLLTPEAREYFK